MNQAVNNPIPVVEKNEKSDIKHLCIIQLTRMGDIIQTVQSVSGIQEKEPHIFTTIVVRESFGTPLMFLLEKKFNRVVMIKYENLWADSMTKTKSNIAHLLEDIQSPPIDAIVNLSFCTPSKYLSSILKSKHKLGPYLDKNLNEIIHDKWSQYFYANVLTGNHNPFSLVDLFSSIIGNKRGRPQIFTQQEKSHSIVINPFTSQERKTWKITKWIEIFYKLLKETDHKIYIVGSSSDREKTNEILKHPLLSSFAKRTENWVGEKSVQDVFNLLRMTKLFIGHDSMVSHLAALQQTPSIILTLGNARPMETSPYNPHAFILTPKIDCFPCQLQKECSIYLCHQDVSYQGLLHVALKVLSQGTTINYKDILEGSSVFYFTKTRLYKSSFSNTNKYLLKKISKDPLRIEDVFNIFYRMAWQYRFEEAEENTAFPRITKEISQKLPVAIQGLAHIFELCEFAQKYIRYTLEEVAQEIPDLSNIKNYSYKIDEVDKLLKIVSKTSPELSPLVNYSIVSKSNLTGSNLIQLSESAYLSYEILKNLSSIIHELAEKTLARNSFKEERKKRVDA